MATYYKVNPKVVEYLNIKDFRNKTTDGNFILWRSDMLKFGPMYLIKKTLQKIGGIEVTPFEAKQERLGIKNRTLPTATDPQFVIADEATGTEEVVEQTETIQKAAKSRIREVETNEASVVNMEE